jgi:pyruvate/2-oxoglutarate dehydrogenase complex dihydrolipoamide dehydrogenase (E3) component
MKTEHFSTIIIGAGSGGMTVAVGLSTMGHKVALIEGQHVGGDCTNVGCVPSKTLIHLAKNFNPSLDANTALKEVTRKRDALRDLETEEVQHMENLTFIDGWAKFTGPKSLSVTQNDIVTHQLTADQIVISTGARPRDLEISGLPPERYLTNLNLFDLTQLPKHLVIVGAGVIALEMAFAFQKFGTQVTMLALDPRPLMQAIPEASEAIQAEIERRGIQTYYGATAHAYNKRTQTLNIQSGEDTLPIENVDQVLVAIGRIRNIDNLALETAGIEYDRDGIEVNHYGETTVKGVYAIGDVTPTSAFTHSANAQGRRVSQRIAFPWLPLKRKEPIFPNATFSDPEVATVGMTPQELANHCHPEAIKRIRVDFKTDTDRGYTDDIENGFIIVDAVRLTGKILHATIVGPRASEMISFFTLAISQGISLYKIYRLVYPYPTFSSGILKIADYFMRDTLTNIRKELFTYLRYRFAPPR